MAKKKPIRPAFLINAASMNKLLAYEKALVTYTLAGDRYSPVPEEYLNKLRETEEALHKRIAYLEARLKKEKALRKRFQEGRNFGSQF